MGNLGCGELIFILFGLGAGTLGVGSLVLGVLAFFRTRTLEREVAELRAELRQPR